MHRDLWTLVAEAPFLADGSGGGALFVSPTFTNYDTFDDFVSLVRRARASRRSAARMHGRRSSRPLGRHTHVAAGKHVHL